jgi:hypothetical protein
VSRTPIAIVQQVLLATSLAIGLHVASVAQPAESPTSNPSTQAPSVAPPRTESTASPAVVAPESRETMLRVVASPQWWTAGFLCLLVLVGVFQVVMFGAQLRLMRRGLDEYADLVRAAKESSESSKASWGIVQRMERAFVTVEVAAMGPPLASEARPWTEDGKTNVSAKVILRNQGRTPAAIRTADIGLVALFSPPIKFKSFPETLHLIPPALVIGPSGSYELEISRSFIKAEWQDLVSGKRMLLCGGRILYDDVLDRLNETGFCWQRSESDGHDRYNVAYSAELNYFKYDLPRHSGDAGAE